MIEEDTSRRVFFILMKINEKFLNVTSENWWRKSVIFQHGDEYMKILIDSIENIIFYYLKRRILRIVMDFCN